VALSRGFPRVDLPTTLPCDVRTFLQGVSPSFNLAISFAVPSIAWQDHVGGLVTGAVLTAAYAYAPRKHRTLIQLGATIAILAILVLATVIRTGQLT